MATVDWGLPTVAVLRHRDFRLLWCGLVISSIGTWMQILAQSLLVLDLSHGSVVALGSVSLAQAAAFMLFALWGGAIADRVDKRRLLLVTQSLSLSFALLLGVLTVCHLIAVWMVIGIAFLNGAALSFDQPARGALVPALVPPDELFNAVSLQSVVFTGASTLGPAVAGFGLATWGYAGNFFLNALSYLGVIVAVLAMRAKGAGVPLRTPNPRAIREALAAVHADAVLPAVIGVYGALLFFGPSAAVLLPIMGRLVLHFDAERIGMLFAASGLGAVIGGLLLASLRAPAHKARMVLTAAGLWAFSLAGFGVSRSLAGCLIALFLVGLFQVAVGATTVTLLQSRVPAAMRGRVMSLNSLLNMAVRPLGDFPATALIAVIGAPLAAVGAALVVLLVTLGAAARFSVRGA